MTARPALHDMGGALLNLTRDDGCMEKPVTESVWNRFDNTWLEKFVGLSLEAAVAQAEAEGRPVRVVRPDSFLTADFRPDRLNLRMDAAGEVQGLSAG